MTKPKKKTPEVKILRNPVKPVTVTVKSASHTPQKQPDQIKENPVMTFLFGHPSLDKKDMIEIGILFILVAFLGFMQLKLNNII